MIQERISRRRALAILGGAGGAALTSGCGFLGIGGVPEVTFTPEPTKVVQPERTPTPRVVEKEVTRIVEKVATVQVEKEVTRVVEKVVTATPNYQATIKALSKELADARATSVITNARELVDKTPTLVLLTPEVKKAVAKEIESCPSADQIAIWTPDNGKGRDIELTTDANHILHANLWWPGRNVFEGGEVSVVLGPNQAFNVLGAAGTAWSYSARCGMELVKKEAQDHIARRKQGDANAFGVVTIDDLMKAGLVEPRKKAE